MFADELLEYNDPLYEFLRRLKHPQNPEAKLEAEDAVAISRSLGITNIEPVVFSSLKFTHPITGELRIGVLYIGYSPLTHTYNMYVKSRPIRQLGSFNVRWSNVQFTTAAYIRKFFVRDYETPITRHMWYQTHDVYKAVSKFLDNH